jgi:hypothetical protein
MRSSERGWRFGCVFLPTIPLFLSSLFLVSLFSGGCLFDQRREMVEARATYQKCLDEHPEDGKEKCAELEAESITRSERYEDDARRAWGCGGTSGPACDPRDRAPRIP